MMENTWNYSPILKDPQMELQLEKEGYLVIPRFLSSEAVSELAEYNEANQPEFVHNAIINSVWHSSDVEYKENTIKKIIDVYTPFCEKYFVNYNIFGGSFVIKPPHGKGESNPHIDFGIVNEDVHRSFNLWIPLVPTTKENGALQVLRGSHNQKKVFRGPNIPDQTLEIRDWFWEKSNLLELQPGDAVLYDHRAIHGSKSNFSSVPRVATSCALTNAGAEMVLYFWDEEKRKVVAYETDPTYLLTNNHDKLPTDLEVTAEWDYSLDQLTIEDLGATKSKPPGILSRMFNLLKN
ncbi:phytanoyl-CoA dioxygenase family protein [Flavobacteriales bacterium]|nr:phytanoyl-CoA dioxygenase family protein [Flavobacteriales bacterium]